MTDKIMQISFLPQDIELIRGFLHGKNYSNIISYNNSLDSMHIDLSKRKGYDILFY